MLKGGQIQMQVQSSGRDAVVGGRSSKERVVAEVRFVLG
jgi:hypothetical protein